MASSSATKIITRGSALHVRSRHPAYKTESGTDKGLGPGMVVQRPVGRNFCERSEVRCSKRKSVRPNNSRLGSGSRDEKRIEIPYPARDGPTCTHGQEPSASQLGAYAACLGV